MTKGLVTAVRTLSLLPIPGRDADDMSASLPWFPVVGALLGSGLFAIDALVAYTPVHAWSSGVAFLLLLLSTVLTRGLHLDGLADAADGFFSMTERQRTLAIMKDSRVGTFGVLALLLVLGCKWVALEGLVAGGKGVWIIPAFVVSRAVMAELAATLDYARTEGGTGAPFVAGARNRHRLFAWGISGAILLPMGPLAMVALVIGAALSRIMARVYKRKVGGVTGDLLGAASELSEAVLLLFCAFSSYGAARIAGWGALSW